MGDRNFVQFPSVVFEIWYSQGFGRTDSRSHSRTYRPNYRMPPALFFNDFQLAVSTDSMEPCELALRAIINMNSVFVTLSAASELQFEWSSGYYTAQQVRNFKYSIIS